MTVAAAPDPETAAAIARAEERRAVLERLTQLGMTMAEALTQQAASPDDPRPDPGPTFAKVARAVRMSVALETKLDELILALRNGGISGRRAAGNSRARPASAPEPTIEEPGQCPLRDPIQLAVWSAIDQTVMNEDEALHRYDRVYERLFDSCEYDNLDLDDFEGAVKAICADIGVAPNWAAWTDGESFGAHDPLPRSEWRSRWSWDPAAAEARRKRLLAPPARPKPIRALARSGPFRLE